ncbi:hypothetical protein G9A89_011125, partial [Geosiphon pyriformis]
MVIGFVSTIQMAIGFGFDVIKITNPRRSASSPPITQKRRSGLNEYWQRRRKAYQEMIDGLYVKYMNNLVGVQQQQQQPYFQHQQQRQQQYVYEEPEPIYRQQDRFHYQTSNHQNVNVLADEYGLGVRAERELLPIDESSHDITTTESVNSEHEEINFSNLINVTDKNTLVTT